MVKIFMENAAPLRINLNAIEEDGMTAFHYACERGHTDVVKIFMENAPFLSLDLNAKDYSDFTGFHYACRRGHSETVKVLMENASIVGAIDKNVLDFYLASGRERSDVVKILMENASTLSIDINTTCIFENYDAYALCFSTGISIGFQLACKEGHSDVIKIFLGTLQSTLSDFLIK